MISKIKFSLILILFFITFKNYSLEQQLVRLKKIFEEDYNAEDKKNLKEHLPKILDLLYKKKKSIEIEKERNKKIADCQKSINDLYKDASPEQKKQIDIQSLKNSADEICFNKIYIPYMSKLAPMEIEAELKKYISNYQKIKDPNDPQQDPDKKREIIIKSTALIKRGPSVLAIINHIVDLTDEKTLLNEINKLLE